MPYAPSVNDRSGEIFAHGVSQSLDTLLRGVGEYRREKKRKEDEEAAVEFLKTNGARFGLNVQDDKELKSAVKAAGGGPQAIQVLQAIEEHEQRKQMVAQQQKVIAAQLAEGEERRAAAARNAGALRVATGGTPSTRELGAMITGGGDFRSTMPRKGGGLDEDAVQQYLAAGGDAGGAGELAQVVERFDKIREGKRTFKPEVMNLGEGVTAMTTSRSSAVPVAKGPTKDTGKSPILSQDGLFYKSREDDEWKPLPRERTMDFDSFMMGAYSGDPNDMTAARKAYREYISAGQGAKGTPDNAGDKPAAPAGPITITSEDEFKKLKPGEKFIWNGRQGVKK